MKRKIYRKSFKENSVRLMSERNDIPSLARELGVTTRLLYKWCKDFSVKGTNSFPGNGNSIQSEEVKEFQSLNGFISSMSRKSNCWDNAVAESFIKISSL